jgi:predicted membrane metal-binding protein
MAWISGPVGGGVRVGTRIGGGRGGGGGGVFATLFVFAFIYAGVMWLWHHPLILIGLIGSVVLLVGYLIDRAQKQQAQAALWQVGHRTTKTRYIVVLRREDTGEEVTVRSIPTDAADFSERLSEARAEARVKAMTLEAHERREAEMQR